MRPRKISLLLLFAILATGAVTPGSAGPRPSCTPRILVLSAFPAEIDGLLTQLVGAKSERVEGRRFFLGKLRGNNVVLGLSGIGLMNAQHTTQVALGHYRCGARSLITAIVFSGVAGGRTFIGDVAVPGRWTLDQRTWIPVNPEMLDVARAVAPAAASHLKQDAPLGDCACAGIDPDLVTVVHLDHKPQILLGGDGLSSDPFGGRTFPCVPGGGDVFGCEPCRAQIDRAPDVVGFLTTAAPFIDPNFFLSYFQSPPASAASHDAEDMETAAVAREAARNNIPFIGFRGVSDGQGDPFMLPGFPFQFFAYRQIAAENAATVTLAFLDAWRRR